MARPSRYDHDDDEDDALEMDDADGIDAPKSKSQVKRDLLALDPLTEELMGLPDRQLNSLGLSDKLVTALRAARALKRGALKRQLRYARGLLAEEDHAGAAAAVAAFKQPRREQIDALHELEDWRERLLAGDSALLDELFSRYGQVDRQQLLQLVRNAKAERAAGSTPRAARALFKFLGAMRDAAPDTGD
jgi:ribosome-associated protein